jgi:hypothetical protein
VAPELAGARIRQDLLTITGFSRASRSRGDQLWGRVSGFRSGMEVISWAADQFRLAGIRDVSVQRFGASSEMWWPESWEVTLLKNTASGRESAGIPLASALPVSGSTLSGGPIVAPLVEVASSNGFGADFATVDVRGKVAVQQIRLFSQTETEWQWAGRRSRALIARGALGVINVVDLPGNMHVLEDGGCRGLCFNLGSADGEFLLRVMRNAATAGAEEPRIRLRVDASRRVGMRAANTVAVIPGNSAEAIVITAPIDGWFEAAGDHGDALAVMMSLARHFAKAENRPERTLVFVASAGQNSQGLDGATNFVRMNRDLLRTAVAVLDLANVAQFRTDRYPWDILPSEETMTVRITGGGQFLDDVSRRGVARYGFRARIAPDTGMDAFADGLVPGVAGRTGGFSDAGVPVVRISHEGMLLHTTGDMVETISTPGLERAARFVAYFVRQLDTAPVRMINP